MMDSIIGNPNSDQDFFGMTYKYHADALNYPQPLYHRIKTPFLVITGALDSLIQSSDDFVEKAREAGVEVTYMRIHDMDHYVRKRPDIIAKSFEWLGKQL